MVLLPIDPSTIEEWRAAMTAILEAPIARAHLTILIDRRKSAAVTVGFVNLMTSFFATHQRALSGGRRAIVVADDAGYGMARMTELKSEFENPDSTVRVFRDYDAAVRWLTSG